MGQSQQQKLLTDDTIKLQAEVDFNSKLIDERGQIFNQAESLMNDINAIAAQINQNTKKQGSELVRADANMTDVVVNAEAAHKEIIEARSY
jgi:hypothetical protein